MDNQVYEQLISELQNVSAITEALANTFNRLAEILREATENDD